MAARRRIVYLEPEEDDALYNAASQACRDVRSQARYFIRRALEQNGLLPPALQRDEVANSEPEKVRDDRAR